MEVVEGAVRGAEGGEGGDAPLGLGRLGCLEGGGLGVHW